MNVGSSKHSGHKRLLLYLSDNQIEVQKLNSVSEDQKTEVNLLHDIKKKLKWHQQI